MRKVINICNILFVAWFLLSYFDIIICRPAVHNWNVINIIMEFWKSIVY